MKRILSTGTEGHHVESKAGGNYAGTVQLLSREIHQREDGPTAVEYAVLLALIIAACLIAISALGNNANNTFDEVGEHIR